MGLISRVSSRTYRDSQTYTPRPNMGKTRPNSLSESMKSCVPGKLKMVKHSKEKDKKRKKKEKKKKLKEEAEQRRKDELQNQAIPTRRRFENQSGRRDCEVLGEGLTRNQLNKIQVFKKREVEDLLKEGELSYGEKQRRYNKYCQE